MLLVVQLCCIHHSSVLVLALVDDPPSCSSLSRMHHFLLQHHYSHTHTIRRKIFPSSRSGAAACIFSQPSHRINIWKNNSFRTLLTLLSVTERVVYHLRSAGLCNARCQPNILFRFHPHAVTHIRGHSQSQFAIVSRTPRTVVVVTHFQNRRS